MLRKTLPTLSKLNAGMLRKTLPTLSKLNAGTTQILVSAFTTQPHVSSNSSYQQLLLTIDKNKKKSLSEVCNNTSAATLQELVTNSAELNEIIAVAPWDVNGAHALFHTLGPDHLSKIITSVDSFLSLPPNIILSLSSDTLKKALDTSEKLERAVIWASQSHFEIHSGQRDITLQPTYFLDSMLAKLGKDYVTNLICNPKSLWRILPTTAFFNDAKIRDTLGKYLDLDAGAKPRIENTTLDPLSERIAPRL